MTYAFRTLCRAWGDANLSPTRSKTKKKKGKQMTLDAMLPKHAARVRSPPLSIMPASSCQAGSSVNWRTWNRSRLAVLTDTILSTEES